MPADTLNHPEPLALYTLTDQRAPFAFACSVCRRTVHLASDIDPAWAKRHASLCCSTACDTCGGSKPARGYCAACRRANEEKREAEMFAKAVKLPADYAGPVYNPFNDRFDATVGDALEHAEQEDEPPPSYLWACHEETAQLDAEDILARLVEELCEDYEVTDREGFVAFCREWNAKQTSESWTPDYSRVIVLGGDDV